MVIGSTLLYRLGNGPTFFVDSKLSKILGYKSTKNMQSNLQNTKCVKKHTRNM